MKSIFTNFLGGNEEAPVLPPADQPGYENRFAGMDALDLARFDKAPLSPVEDAQRQLQRHNLDLVGDPKDREVSAERRELIDYLHGPGTAKKWEREEDKTPADPYMQVLPDNLDLNRVPPEQKPQPQEEEDKEDRPGRLMRAATRLGQFVMSSIPTAEVRKAAVKQGEEADKQADNKEGDAFPGFLGLNSFLERTASKAQNKVSKEDRKARKNKSETPVPAGYDPNGDRLQVFVAEEPEIEPERAAEPATAAAGKRTSEGVPDFDSMSAKELDAFSKTPEYHMLSKEDLELFIKNEAAHLRKQAAQQQATEPLSTQNLLGRTPQQRDPEPSYSPDYDILPGMSYAEEDDSAPRAVGGLRLRITKAALAAMDALRLTDKDYAGAEHLRGRGKLAAALGAGAVAVGAYIGLRYGVSVFKKDILEQANDMPKSGHTGVAGGAFPDMQQQNVPPGGAGTGLEDMPDPHDTHQVPTPKPHDIPPDKVPAPGKPRHLPVFEALPLEAGSNPWDASHDYLVAQGYEGNDAQTAALKNYLLPQIGYTEATAHLIPAGAKLPMPNPDELERILGKR